MMETVSERNIEPRISYTLDMIKKELAEIYTLDIKIYRKTTNFLLNKIDEIIKSMEDEIYGDKQLFLKFLGIIIKLREKSGKQISDISQTEFSFEKPAEYPTLQELYGNLPAAPPSHVERQTELMKSRFLAIMGPSKTDSYIKQIVTSPFFNQWIGTVDFEALSDEDTIITINNFMFPQARNNFFYKIAKDLNNRQ